MLRRYKNRTGSAILLSVFLIILIVSLLALSLSRQANVDLSLAEYAQNKLKAKYAAWGGWIYSISLLKQSSADDTAEKIDTRFQCGVRLDKNQHLEDLFAHVPLGASYFEVSHELDNDKGFPARSLGFIDEERKINLNAINAHNYKVLAHLLVILEVDYELANDISIAIVDWVDSDKKVFNQPEDVPEDNFYTQTVRYGCKNKPLDSIDELLLIKGVTPTIFKKMKDFVTVFPKDATQLSINLNTASPEVIKALAAGFVDSTNTDIDDADSLARKIAKYRRGDDGLEATEDDREVAINQIQFNSQEKALFAAIAPATISYSTIFRIRVKGVEASSGVTYMIEGVTTRKDFSILSWERG